MHLKEAIETAFAYHRAGDLKTAESCYDQILGQLDKPDPNVFFGLGTLLVSQQKYGLGIALLQAALSFAPDNAAILTNLGCAFKHMGRDELSLHCYERALAIEPDQADILAGMAGFWINKNEAAKVVEYASRAIGIDPGHHAARMHLALGLMEQGKYAEAWPHYESRWETIERVQDKRPYKAPMWKGEKVKTLAIHGEQGLGDEILFMSCLSKVRPFAENIIIECAERLIPTFKASFSLPCYKDHQSLIAAHGEPDAYISMGSLPGIVGLPDGKPFLKRNSLHNINNGPYKRPKIGLAWKGGTIRTNHKDRSLTLDDFAPITSLQNINFVSVQYGDTDADNLHQHRMFNVPTDFDSLQERIADCDLVISVCQTAVHQAGAMGVECWTLVPQRAAWRYSGSDMMPWYRSVRFFCQSKDMDWQPVIENIASTLRAKYALLAA